ncbi:hypothetical protein MW887_012065 [Aspergillus wentii]|nr:hypothetical protein MW887_012065 [Aspergillus wentii]
MGYTHYFRVRDWRSKEWQSAWPQLVQDVQPIVDAADVPITGPDGEDEDTVTPPLADVDKGIELNGVADGGHEWLVINKKEATRFSFVKTVRKPYDAVVACVLLRAYMLAPRQFKLSSDGFWDEREWIDARQLYETLWPDETLESPFQEEEEA